MRHPGGDGRKAGGCGILRLRRPDWVGDENWEVHGTG